MAKYRIKEYIFGAHKNYLVQRKSIFGFWYNPDNIDADTTGWYDTIEEAKEVIIHKLTPIKTKIVWRIDTPINIKTENRKMKKEKILVLTREDLPEKLRESSISFINLPEFNISLSEIQKKEIIIFVDDNGKTKTLKNR